ncbi:MAG: prolipoprotein diacylglyceryl transferase family protein, partial [Trebonia sp.]
QAVGRIGNYFNKELFGKPTTLPWGLEIPYQYRVSGGIPAQDWHFSTFQPSFLYELIWDLALAALLVWLGHRAKMKPWSLFALYVAGYSGYRIFEETIRVDSSEHFLGLRLNLFVAVVLTVIGLIWFAIAQSRPERAYTVLPPGPPEEAGAAEATPDEAAQDGATRHDATAAEAPDGRVDADAEGKATADRSPGHQDAADGAEATTSRSE